MELKSRRFRDQFKYLKLYEYFAMKSLTFSKHGKGQDLAGKSHFEYSDPLTSFSSRIALLSKTGKCLSLLII